MSDVTEQNSANKRKWPKKRKTFISNAKKHAKKGQMGRGTKMPEELYQYFLGILEVIKKGIEDQEERYVLVNNVLERTKGEELNVVGNQLGSRVIELLLPYSSSEDLERFMEVLSPELRRLCSDNFTSHVVETLLRVACERATAHLQGETNEDLSDTEVVPKKKPKLAAKESKYTEEHIQKCYDFTVKLSKYALNNLEDFVWDSYANHILRSTLRCLSGITLLPGEKPKLNLFKEHIQQDKGVPPHLTKMTYKSVPDDFKDIVKDFGNRLSSWPQFKDLPYKNITSALLQVLLYAVKNVDKNLTRDLIKKLLNESFAPEDWVSEGPDDKKEEKVDVGEETGEDKSSVQGRLPPVFESESAVRLLEAALFVAKKKTYTQMYARCFINRLARLSTLRMLNFTVQRLIDNCQVKEEFEPIFDEVVPKLSSLLAGGNSGVLVALVKACMRVRARQAQFVTALEAALECSEAEHQKHFAVCCLRLAPRTAARDPKQNAVHVHGSVVMQTILEFQRPAKAVSSLLDLDSEELVAVFSEARGCHVADALCKGQCVGVKTRDKLVWKLKGFYQKLALSQYGSRAFEQVFGAAPLEQKLKIMTEIADKSSLMNSTQYGRVVASVVDLETFKKSQKSWEDRWRRKGDKSEEGKENK